MADKKPLSARGNTRKLWQWFSESYGAAWPPIYCERISEASPLVVLLLQENLHVLKVKGHRVRFEKIVTDHAGEVKAKHVFPRERPIV